MNNKNPTLAPYAGLGDVKLRITARGVNSQETSSLIDPIEMKVIERFGNSCYGFNGSDTITFIITPI